MGLPQSKKKWQVSDYRRISHSLKKSILKPVSSTKFLNGEDRGSSELEINENFNKDSFLKRDALTSVKLLKFLEIENSKQKKNPEIEPSFKDLPILKKKYRVVKVIGSGAFGEVLKVQDISSLKFYALKSFCVSTSRNSFPGRKSFFPIEEKTKEKSSEGSNDGEYDYEGYTEIDEGVAEVESKREEEEEGEVENEKEKRERIIEEKKIVIKSAETEWNLLKRLKHKNIVQYIDSFLIPRSPLKKNGSSVHMCLLMEFVQGSDLNTLIKYTEENSFCLPRVIVLKWFIKLLNTLQFLHSENIIHRDLKPDNILVYYSDINNVNAMNVKITDFGVGKDLKEGKGEKLQGHIFYSPLEVLKQTEKYDMLVDIYSLGIILFQTYFAMSIDTYQEKIEELCKLIKDDGKYNDSFCKFFNKMDIYSDTTYIELVIYLHESGLFYDMLINKYLKQDGDKAFKIVLEKMICKKEKRAYAKELLNHNVIKTWQFILNPKEHRIDAIFKLEIDYINIHAINTFLKIVDDEVPIFYNIEIGLYLFLKNIKNPHDENLVFFKNFIIYQLFEKLQPFLENEKIIVVFFNLLLVLIQKDNKFLHTIQTLLRTYPLLIKILKKLMFKQNINLPKRMSQKISFLVLILLENNNTLKMKFQDVVIPIVLKYCADETNLTYFYLSKYLTKLIQKEKQIEKIYSISLNTKNILFLQLNTFFNQNSKILKTYYKFFVKNFYTVLKNYKNTKNNTSNQNLIRFLIHLLFSFSFYRSYHDIEFIPKNKDNSLQLLSNNEINNVEISKTGKTFTAVNAIHKICYIISKKPIVDNLNTNEINEKEDDVVIGYYSINILDGGLSDNFEIGFLIEDSTKSKYILLNCKEKTIKLFSQGKNEENTIESKLNYLPLLCDTFSYIGVGVTNKSKFFYTINNRIVKPFLDLDFKSDKANIYTLLNVEDNLNLQGYINFGEDKFNFNFRNYLVEKNNLVSLQILKTSKIKEKLMEFLKKKQNAVPPIPSLIGKISKLIIHNLDNDTNQIFDKELINLYERENCFKEILKRNQSLYFNKQSFEQTNYNTKFKLVRGQFTPFRGSTQPIQTSYKPTSYKPTSYKPTSYKPTSYKPIKEKGKQSLNTESKTQLPSVEQGSYQNLKVYFDSKFEKLEKEKNIQIEDLKNLLEVEREENKRNITLIKEIHQRLELDEKKEKSLSNFVKSLKNLNHRISIMENKFDKEKDFQIQIDDLNNELDERISKIESKKEEKPMLGDDFLNKLDIRIDDILLRLSLLENNDFLSFNKKLNVIEKKIKNFRIEKEKLESEKNNDLLSINKRLIDIENKITKFIIEKEKEVKKKKERKVIYTKKVVEIKKDKAVEKPKKIIEKKNQEKIETPLKEEKKLKIPKKDVKIEKKKVETKRKEKKVIGLEKTPLAKTRSRNPKKEQKKKDLIEKTRKQPKKVVNPTPSKQEKVVDKRQKKPPSKEVIPPEKKVEKKGNEKKVETKRKLEAPLPKSRSRAPKKTQEKKDLIEKKQPKTPLKKQEEKKLKTPKKDVKIEKKKVETKRKEKKVIGLEKTPLAKTRSRTPKKEQKKKDPNKEVIKGSKKDGRVKKTGSKRNPPREIEPPVGVEPPKKGSSMDKLSKKTSIVVSRMNKEYQKMKNMMSSIAKKNKPRVPSKNYKKSRSVKKKKKK